MSRLGGLTGGLEAGSRVPDAGDTVGGSRHVVDILRRFVLEHVTMHSQLSSKLSSQFEMC